ncbi:lipase maturation factor family protein [Mycobacterium lepromatosis]|nr:lipase maturation factor family protein [Mycobacterium lepromatosis]
MVSEDIEKTTIDKKVRKEYEFKTKPGTVRRLQHQ